MIMIGYNEVMAMNVDQCKLCYHMLCVHTVSYASLMLYACYASHMLCVHDVMKVMQVICYVFMMLCKLCKSYDMCS